MSEPTAKTNSREANENARAFAKQSGPFDPRRCLQFVRTCWGLPVHFATARDARVHATKVGKFHKWTGDTEDIPYGAPVFTRRKGAPSSDSEHIVITGGHFLNRERIFRSVDVFTAGDVDAVPMDFFEDKWDHEILGWSEELNGFLLPLPVSPNDRPKRKPKKKVAK